MRIDDVRGARKKRGEFLDSVISPMKGFVGAGAVTGKIRDDDVAAGREGSDDGRPHPPGVPLSSRTAGAVGRPASRRTLSAWHVCLRHESRAQGKQHRCFPLVRLANESPLQDYFPIN